MLITMVYIHIKPENLDSFKQATIENASHSLVEPGIARFDVIQQVDDPTRFVLIEVYRSEDDPAKHRQTTHYQKWRTTVESMMAEERTRTLYKNIFPEGNGWG
jgi:(4S)-4-hydroxy-5-phosphonooxypentane-2,3-dione isomerase